MLFTQEANQDIIFVFCRSCAVGTLLLEGLAVSPELMVYLCVCVCVCVFYLFHRWSSLPEDHGHVLTHLHGDWVG